MARITCQKVSAGRLQSLYTESVPTGWTTIAEADDFSIPDPARRFTTRDPLDDDRAILPGQLYFLRPLYARNTSAGTLWIEAQVIFEDGDEVPWFRASVPTLETVAIPVQGFALVKRVAAGANGDRLQLRAQSALSFCAWGASEASLSPEHIGVS